MGLWNREDERAWDPKRITWVCESCEGSFQRESGAVEPGDPFCPFCGADEGAAYDVRNVVFLTGGGFVVRGAGLDR